MPTPENALRDLEFLQENGYAIPDALLDLVSEEVNKKNKIVQIWGCQKCKYEYKSNVNISGASCPQNHQMKLLKKFQI